MRLDDLAGFDEQRNIVRTFAHHFFPRCGNGDQSRKGGAFFVCSAVAQHDDCRVLLRGPGDIVAQTGESSAGRVGATGDVKCEVHPIYRRGAGRSVQ